MFVLVSITQEDFAKYSEMRWKEKDRAQRQLPFLHHPLHSASFRNQRGRELCLVIVKSGNVPSSSTFLSLTQKNDGADLSFSECWSTSGRDRARNRTAFGSHRDRHWMCIVQTS
mmetsp:Transcript_9913/g.22880  ORF Transcript_9913/g.22880 Transcript_9913/m.22880 type:complete len:114 (-) Transcript_9913:507-848(-)